MLENLVAWVLNNYVGEYLENLNTDQLSIALLQGQVELENVPLKKSALRKLDVPLQVKSGLLGKLTLSVPLTRLRSEPWVVKMSDLLVLLEPATSVRYDVETVEVYEQNKKEQQLEELEKYHERQLLNYCGLPSSDASQQNWWGASLVSTIVNNIQLILTNVHIRYDDNTTLPNNAPFVCGMRIHSVSIQTTDSHWTVGYMQPQDGANMFKKLEIDGLSVYWNCGQKVVQEIKNYVELQCMMAPEINKQNVCILHPFSAHLYMERNMNKFPLKTYPYTPRFKFSVRPEKVVIELTKRQLMEISSLGKEWARFDRARQHRKWRPLTTVGENAKEWWNFAYNRVQEKKRQQKIRNTWSFAYNRARQLNAYCRAYRRRLLSCLESASLSERNQMLEEKHETSLSTSVSDQNSDIENHSRNEITTGSSSKVPTTAISSKKITASEDSVLMKQIERDSSYSYHELQLFRETVFRRIIAEKEKQHLSNEEEFDVENFENIHLPPSNNLSHNARTSSSGHSKSEEAPKNSAGGLYRWFSSWMYGPQKSSEQEMTPEKNVKAEENVFSFLLSDDKENNLPADFKQLEKQVEDEILDVLNESRDDLTILHRDTLLAEVKLKLERMTLRFVDDFQNHNDGSVRVLAMDLWQLASCVHLSPRRHSTAVSLTVMDMSLQRLCTLPAEDFLAENARDNENSGQEGESLMFGFGGAKESTQILFAIGKAGKDKNMTKFISTANTHVENGLFRMVYHRRAPKMTVTHTLDARFSGLSVLYNEGAFDDIAAFFNNQNSSKQNEKLDSVRTGASHIIDFSIQCPQLKVELRSKRGNLLDQKKKSVSSTSFALTDIRRLAVGISNREQFVTTVEVEFDSLEVIDLFESTNDLLLCIKCHPYSLKNRLSASCPNLSAAETQFEPSFLQQSMRGCSVRSLSSAAIINTNDSLKSTQQIVSRKFCGSGFKDVSVAGASHFTIILRSKEHPSFESVYKKVSCLVSVDVPAVEICMNRRSYTLLLDFFGILEPKMSLSEKEAETNIVLRDTFNLEVNINAGSVQLRMNFPASNSHLGVIKGEEVCVTVQGRVGDDEFPLKVLMSLEKCLLSDSTPFYSELYNERLTLQSSLLLHKETLERTQCADHKNQKSTSHPKATIEVTRCMSAKLASTRGYDTSVEVRVPATMNIAYIHTHRYFCTLLEFWLQFVELQDIVLRSNTTEMRNNSQQRARIQLICEINCPCAIIFPLNQLSNQVILGETAMIRISNRFQLASTISDFKDSVIGNIIDDDKYDCTIDWMSVVCAETAFYEGVRIPNTTISVREVKDYERVCQNSFQHFHFLRPKKSVFSRPYDFLVNIYRNLDVAVSHSAPDIAITTSLIDLGIKFTSDFYRLFRGFLSMNLGDTLVPVPETIPIEVLQKPVELYEVVAVSQKYTTFSFRMTLSGVELNCFIPCENPSEGFSPFAGVKLNCSRISFDVYIDNQSELDLICESSELIDIRFMNTKFGERANVFPSVLYPLTKESESGKLMYEAHMIFKSDESPIITLVLLNARVLLLLDWLNEAKNFILLQSDFIPPVEDTYRNIGSHVNKLGIVQRNPPVSEAQEQTFSLRITLKECELVLIERPESVRSLAMAAHVTAVLNMSDAGGMLQANLEIQRMNIDWFMMASESETRCQLTNHFSMTFILTAEVDSSEERLPSKVGILSVLPPKHLLSVEVNEMVTRVSYRDLYVINNVLSSSLKRLKESLERNTIANYAGRYCEKEKSVEINIVHTIVKSAQISFWLLDDHQGPAFPIIRCKFKKFFLDRYLEKMNGSFVFAIDYFNQSVYGWEPLIEDWYLKQITVVAKGGAIIVDVIADERSTFNINITQAFLQQAMHLSSQLSEIKHALDEDFRGKYIRPRSDHLPYILRNETGSDLRFTTAVDEVLEARSKQRKSTARWYQTAADATTTFEFPTKRLTNMEHSEDMRQLIIRVEGWDEISPVNVDAIGTYFRLARCSNSRASNGNAGMNVRLVVVVTMDKNGRKVVTVHSALAVVNHLSDPVLLMLVSESSKVPEKTSVRIDPKKTLQVPLKFANAYMAVKPDGLNTPQAYEIRWQEVKGAGEKMNKLFKFETEMRGLYYWMCVSVKREHYPEYEVLSGHTINLVPPLCILNLLPVDAEFRAMGRAHAVTASKQIQVTSLDISENINFDVVTDRFESVRKITITKSSMMQKSGDVDRLHLRMKDSKKRYLDMYCSISIGSAGTVSLAFWVPYWIVNKSGVPLIIKQDAVDNVAAGQMEEHERAKDRNPLMFSFANENCPKQCVLRIGQNYIGDQGYKSLFGPKFPLTVGLNSLDLQLVHEHLPTQIYNIGVEVRQGTGRYKDTQVVMLTPRYILNNQTSFGLSLSHIDHIHQPKQHVKMASKCSLVWNENFEDNRMICVKRDDVKYWSCPFRIDLISSFHVTMRDADETPQFLRVEVILNSAIFHVTFIEALYYPPPIQLENFSDVPVLYQQKIESSQNTHLRAICKARSTVDYAWDDHYAPKLLTLQVFENKSNIYDPQKLGMGPPLVYANDVYIKYSHSFKKKVEKGFTDELELTLEVMRKGKVMLNKLSLSDSSCNQLWRFTHDGCLENIGMNNRVKPGERYVLDVLDNDGFVLMMLKRNPARDRYQKWQFTAERRLRCKVEGMFVEARKTEVVLAIPNKNSIQNAEGVPIEQVWELQSQRPGSGILDVECLHRGPTLVVRITDRVKPCRTHVAPCYVRGMHSIPATIQASHSSLWNYEVNISMRNGLGLSFVNGSHEELIYARFQGIVLHMNRQGPTYQITGSVEVIQADNQLLWTDRWAVLFCQQDTVSNESDSSEAHVVVPALKLEMNWTPMEHYDAFDCFRLRICDLSVQLDETLLWKIVQFVQKTEASESMKPDVLLQPPNIELDKLDRVQARHCYFGTLEVEIGTVTLSVVTVGTNGLPSELRKLKRQFNVKLVSFENAVISLPPFRQFRYFQTVSFLVETLSKFYLGELKNQTFNIIVTMDAFGNPLGLASDLKESFEGLIFEGNLGGFVSGLGYGVTKSISKVASSMATGVGSLTFDERHEMMRRRMLRCQPQTDSSTALAHFYCGVKGLGVGVLGGLTAIMTNTYNESRKDGITGAVRGLTTGAVDTLTKPVQGIFDLVEGTASAVKEMVSGSAVRKSHFPPHRVRLPRVTMNLQSLLPCYSEELSCAQLELLRINGFVSNEMLLDVEMLLDQITAKGQIRQYALVCSEQCYILRKIDGESSSVVQRIPYRQLKTIQSVPVNENNLFGTIEVVLEISPGRKQRLPHIWCYRFEVAKRLCEKVGRAKQLYDHAKRTLNIVDDLETL